MLVSILTIAHVVLFSIQLKQSAADKLVQCENVKIDWGLNEVRLI